MNLWGGIWRLPTAPRTRASLVAAIPTALIPAACASVILWLFPQGCDIRGDAALYRWTCLLPSLLVSVPLFAAVILPVAMLLNTRFGRPVPDGWLPTVLLTGILSQAVLVGGYFYFLDSAYRDPFLAELLSIPQPFLAGVVAAAVYCSMLGFWLRRP